MANPFAKAKGTYDLVQKARKIQKELKGTEIEATSADGSITVVFNGEQRMVDIQIDESWLQPDKKRELEKAILNVVGQAISKAQAVAAEQMKKVAGDLNLPPGLGF
ncbi:YbaB/EbfC family nucleoid-associated protein [Patescibacteria group bacterium]|nr:YbaB/EbfC family nucleoid-associated protein [Patescibacteria group bacterium]